MNDWLHFTKINFADESLLQFHVDTRDFSCLAKATPWENPPDLSKIALHKNDFIHTPDEIVQLLTRLQADSGGMRDWRCLMLTGSYDAVRHCGWWDMKYLRIYRTAYGIVVCNKRNYILNKRALAGAVLLTNARFGE